jgi:hypothetical protein
LIERALAVAEDIPDGWERSGALASIAARLAAADPSDPTLIMQAAAVAVAVPDDQERSWALASIAGQLAAIDPSNPELIEQAVAVAETIPSDLQRNEAIARIHAMTRSSMLDELSHWRLRPLSASIDLLNVFLRNCHDKTIAGRIGLALLDVIKEFPAEI